METNRTIQVADAAQLAAATVARHQDERQVRKAVREETGPAGRTPHRVGYGLPCARCRAYYSADLALCPYCGCAERIAVSESQSSAAKLLRETATRTPSNGEGANSDTEALRLAEERERFLREYKSRLYASHNQINPAAAFSCTAENHGTSHEPASVCRTCYSHLQEKADLLEAALQIDVREAARVIYEAVWADPSPADPSRTYQNAALALLAELRRRAGLSLLLGAMQTYSH